MIKKVKKYGRNYKVYKGVNYSSNTSDKMVRMLDNLKEKRKRVHFRFGNTKTGEDWGETNDIEGRIGLSTGEVKIPLLIANKRSTGGGGLLTGSIVKILESKGKKVLHQNKKYHFKKKTKDKYLVKRMKQMGIKI